MANAPGRNAVSSAEPTCAPGRAARRPPLPCPAAQCGTARRLAACATTLCSPLPLESRHPYTATPPSAREPPHDGR